MKKDQLCARDHDRVVCCCNVEMLTGSQSVVQKYIFDFLTNSWGLTLDLGGGGVLVAPFCSVFILSWNSMFNT